MIDERKIIKNKFGEKMSRYYKYNCEYYDIYYCCSDNIIDHGNIKKYDKSRYIVFDYFILDMIDKKIIQYDKRFNNSFTDTIGEFDKVKVEKREYGKEIIISSENKEDIIIKLDKNNNMIGYINNNVENIGNGFLSCNKNLVTLSLSNAINIGDNFLHSNKKLRELKLEKVENIGDNFLSKNQNLTTLTLPNAINIGDRFLY